MKKKKKSQEEKHIYKTREILISSLSYHETLDTSRMLTISDIAFGFHFTFRLNFKNPQWFRMEMRAEYAPSIHGTHLQQEVGWSTILRIYYFFICSISWYVLLSSFNLVQTHESGRTLQDYFIPGECQDLISYLFKLLLILIALWFHAKFCSSLYCSSYEVLLKLANWFSVGLGGFCTASGSFAWKLTSWIATLWYWGKGGHWVVWALRVWTGQISIGTWLGNIWSLSHFWTESATFPCELVCENYFWASRQGQSIWIVLRPHLFSKKILNSKFF